MDIPIDLVHLLKGPPPVIEVVSQNAVQSCESLLDGLRKGKLRRPLRFAFEINSIDEALDAYPQDGARLVAEVIDNSFPFTYMFYRYPNKESGWDIALITSRKLLPLQLYYAKGNLHNEYAMIAPHDLIFDFHMNPLNPHDKNFDLNALKMYAYRFTITCANDLRLILEQQYKKTIP